MEDFYKREAEENMTLRMPVYGRGISPFLGLVFAVFGLIASMFFASSPAFATETGTSTPEKISSLDDYKKLGDNEIDRELHDLMRFTANEVNDMAEEAGPGTEIEEGGVRIAGIDDSMDLKIYGTYGRYCLYGKSDNPDAMWADRGMLYDSISDELTGGSSKCFLGESAWSSSAPLVSNVGISVAYDDGVKFEYVPVSNTDEVEPVIEEEETVAKAPAEPIDTSSIMSVLGVVGAVIGVLFGLILLFFVVTKMFRSSSAKRIVRNESERKWNALKDRHAKVKSEWAQYETDPAKILEYPMFADMADPMTAAFHNIMRTANHLKPHSLNGVLNRDSISSPYGNAVSDLEGKWSALQAEARKVHWSRLSEQERKALQRAKDLLRIAMDTGASEHERQAAYKRMIKEVQGIVVLPNVTVLAIEEKVMKSLSSS